MRNSAWNPGRSILCVALVATACFAIVMVAASKQEFGDELRERDSGTGGYALIAESQINLHQDLAKEEDRLELGFDDDADYLGGLAGRVVGSIMAVPPAVRHARDIAKSAGLHHVYLGNVHDRPALVDLSATPVWRRFAERQVA